MPEPTPPPTLLPTAKDEIVWTTLGIEQSTLDWLMEVARETNRTRSDALREILRNVREQHEQQAKRA